MVLIIIQMVIIRVVFHQTPSIPAIQKCSLNELRSPDADIPFQMSAAAVCAAGLYFSDGSEVKDLRCFPVEVVDGQYMSYWFSLEVPEGRYMRYWFSFKVYNMPLIFHIQHCKRMHLSCFHLFPCSLLD